MLVLNPSSVKFAATTWSDVISVVVDRSAERLIIEWTDSGPHAIFVDVPEERLTVRVTRRLVRDTVLTPRPGDAGELVVYTAPTGGDSLRRRIRVTTVVTGMTHEVAGKQGSVQTILFVGTSFNGTSDPITIEDASDGSF